MNFYIYFEFPTHWSPDAATLLLYRCESFMRFACGELDDLGCHILGDFLPVHLALGDRADFCGEDNIYLLTSNQDTKYIRMFQRISMRLLKVCLRNTVNSLVKKGE